MSTKSVKESRRSKLGDAAEELVATASEASFDPAIFFEKFELFAAIPDAIRQLRRTVLTLAMRGNLVSNDQSQPREDIPSEHVIEGPFAIPDNWTWTTLDAIGTSNIGLTYSPKDISKDGIPVLRSSNIQNGKIDLQDLVRVNLQPKNSVLVAASDLLICARNGSKSLVGKVAVIESLTEPTAFGAFMAIFRCKYNSYIYHFLSSPLFREMIYEVNTTTINQITQRNLKSTRVPLPPLAEQKRIVGKVDELMGLCDRLEALEAERKERHASLSRAALARFADSPTPTNLQFLFHKSFDVEPNELRKSILSMAVRGSISRQEPGDEPADQLISRITKAKKSLISEGEVGKSKPFSLDESSLPFTLPSGWTWCTLDSLCEAITKGSSPKWQGVSYVDKDGGLLFITSENVGNYHLRKLDDLKYVEPKFNEMETRSVLNRGDILMTLVGASIGRTAVYNLDEIANINQAVAKIRVVRGFDADLTGYLLHYLNSPVAIDSMLSSRVVTAQPNISLTNAKEFPIPLPPLAEQKRIVAKVDELMALVDQLEQQLAQSRTLGQQLLEAVVAKLTTPIESKAMESVK